MAGTTGDACKHNAKKTITATRGPSYQSTTANLAGLKKKKKKKKQREAICFTSTSIRAKIETEVDSNDDGGSEAQYREPKRKKKKKKRRKWEGGGGGGLCSYSRTLHKNCHDEHVRGCSHTHACFCTSGMCTASWSEKRTTTWNTLSHWR